MLRSRNQVYLSPETLLLAVADRVFAQFDDLPAKLVFEAFSDARATLRESGVTEPPPQQLEVEVRTRLCELRSARR